MCGRYAASRRPEDLIVEFEAVHDLPDDDTGGAGQQPPPDYNVAPTKPVHVVRRRGRDGRRVLSVARWGLVPSWAEGAGAGGRLINARAETVLTRPAFRSAFLRRRCLIPADGWYEWCRGDTGGKQPTYITPYDGSVLAFAGLCEVWGTDRLLTCAIVTTEAVGPLRAVHDRMPLLLDPDSWSTWLDSGGPEPVGLLAPASPGLVAGLEIRPVGAAVGNVANNGPELTTAADPVEQLAAQTLF